MKIAIIGSGQVGGALGRRWAQLGHEIIFGLRDPNKNSTNELLEEIGPRTWAASIAEAAAAADVIVPATPWPAARNALAAELGFDVVDAGGLIAARYLEPLAILWIHLAYKAGFGPNIAFRLIRR